MDPSNAVVTVSRLWNHPQIYTTITEASIGLHIRLSDFIDALRYELTKDNDLDHAVERVCRGIKAESTKAV